MDEDNFDYEDGVTMEELWNDFGPEAYDMDEDDWTLASMND